MSQALILPAALAVATVLMAGLGGWLPFRTIGARAAVGGALTPLLMVTLNMVLGLPVSTAVVVLGVMAAGGYIWRWRRDGRPSLALHPLWVLPTLVGAVSQVKGGGNYLPYSWDEFSSWLYWAREAFLHDGVAGAESWRVMAYPQGLPLGMLAVQGWYDRFDEMRLLAVQIAWHCGLLALVWEIVRERTARVTTLPAGIIAWVTILLLLAAEAGWTLVPQLLQAEKPQIYFLSTALLLLLAAGLDQEDMGSAALGAGLAVAGTYLIKTTAVAMLPPLIVVAAWMVWRHRRIKPAVLLLLPVALTWLAWRLMVPPVAGCAAGPWSLFTGHGLEETPAHLAARFVPAVSAYLSTFKPAVSGLAAIGLGLGLRDRGMRLTVVAFLLYAVLYMAGLYFMYLMCMLGYEGQILASLQRYVRLPLRIAHLLGLSILVLQAIPLVPTFLRGPARWGTPIVVAVLTLWQVHAISRSLDNVHDRRLEDEWRNDVRATHAGAARLRDLLPPSETPPLVVIVAQGSQGGERIMARYGELSDLRGGPMRHWRTGINFSRGPTATNEWMRAGDETEALAELAAADVLWLVHLDDWATGLLRRLPLESGCEPLSGRILIRRDGRYSCSG